VLLASGWEVRRSSVVSGCTVRHTGLDEFVDRFGEQSTPSSTSSASG
jgi:hypothetical protein